MALAPLAQHLVDTGHLEHRTAPQEPGRGRPSLSRDMLSRIGEPSAILAATGASLLLGVPTTFGTWRFERITGVKGPYRIAAAMTALSVLAALLALA